MRTIKILHIKPQKTLKQSNNRNIQNRANNVIHKVRQNGENNLSNHRLQNKDLTGRSEKSCVQDQLPNFQFDPAINEEKIFILPQELK